MQESNKKYQVNDIVLKKFRSLLSQYRDERQSAYPGNDHQYLNIVLCTHVLPDGIGDLVNLNDFATFLEELLGVKVKTIIFIKDSVLPKVSSIIEGRVSEGCYLIPYDDSDTEALKLTLAGRELVEQLIEKDILKDSDLRVHIATETQIPDPLVTELLTASGTYSNKDWLRFFEIIPGPWQHRPQPPNNSPFPLGTTWMGLLREKKETGLKCDQAVRAISKGCLASPQKKMEYVNQNLTESSCKAIISDALLEGDYIAAGYIHTVSTMQHYLQLLSKTVVCKRIVFVTNKLNAQNMSGLQADALIEAGIGEVVFIRREQAEPNIHKLANTGKQLCVLPMENFSNNEITTLLGIADSTYAAGDTSIGQTLSNMGIPFFDVIPNKESFFTDELPIIIMNKIGEISSLYRYLNACNNLSLGENRQSALETMIEIILKEKENLLQQWQILSDSIFDEYDAYVGFLEFLSSNMPTHIFITVAAKLQDRLTKSLSVNIPTSLSSQHAEFFSYLVMSNKTKLLEHLLNSKQFNVASILDKADNLLKSFIHLSVIQPDNHLLLSFLQDFDEEKQSAMLSDLYLQGLSFWIDTAWIVAFNDRVDIRKCELVEFECALDSVDLSAGSAYQAAKFYLTALFQPVLKQRDTHFLDSLDKKRLLQVASYIDEQAIPETLKKYFEPQKYTLWDAMLSIMRLRLYPESREKLLEVLCRSPGTIEAEARSLIFDMNSDVEFSETFDILSGYGCHMVKNNLEFETMQHLCEEANVLIRQQEISEPDKEYLCGLLSKSVNEINAEAISWLSHDLMYGAETGRAVHNILYCYAFHQKMVGLDNDKSVKESPIPSRESVGNAGFYKAKSITANLEDLNKDMPDSDEYKK